MLERDTKMHIAVDKETKVVAMKVTKGYVYDGS